MPNVIPSFIPGGDAINNAISDFLEGGTVGMETIRRVNYSTSYLWTLDFIDTNGLLPPAPFDDYFPASDVNLDVGTVNSFTFDAGHTTLSFPRNTSFKGMDVTFYDDDRQTLQRWMSDWINLDIFNDGQYVSNLRDQHTVVVPDSFGQTRAVQPIRQIRMALLDRQKQDALVYNYNIVPDGQLQFAGSQASEATQFNMRFNIVEELGRPKAGNPAVFASIRNTLGSFAGRLV